MTYPEMREIFRYLDTLSQKYTVTTAVQIENSWTLEVADDCGAGYRMGTFREFEQKFPHLMLRTEMPRFWGPETACMTWLQVLISLGWVERHYPAFQFLGALQNSTGQFEITIRGTSRESLRSRRSGIYLIDEFDDVKRLIGKR